MVVLPIEFVATDYPGYFWNTKTQTLFSCKVSGELRELYLYKPNKFNMLSGPAYRISVKGRRITLPVSKLKKLKASVIIAEIFPVNDDRRTT